MMIDDGRRPVQVELPSGQVVWVRVSGDDLASPGADSLGGVKNSGNGLAQDTGIGLRRRSEGEGSADSGTETRRLIGFAEAVGGIAESVRASLKKARPDTVEIEFGLDVDVATGQVVSLITEAHASASMKVKLGWDLAARAAAVRAGLMSDEDLDDSPDSESDGALDGFPDVEVLIRPETLDALVGTEDRDDG